MKKLILFYTSALAFSFQLLTFNCSAQFTKLLDFSGSSNGSGPYSSFISDGAFLYGMTYFGGANDLGVIFKIMPDGSGYTKMLDFSGTSNGSNPYGSLFFDGISLYGMTRNGGTNGLGVIFKIMPDGSGFTKLLDFSGAVNGSDPFGSLISAGAFLYGITTLGGTSGMGVVFKIMPDGSGYTKLLDFSGSANGKNPRGSLIFDGTFLYGMTQTGGTNDMGVIFKIMPDGSGFFKLLDFSGTANGSFLFGSFTSDAAFLYGMTNSGGANGMGTIFKIMSDGSGYSKMYDFSGIDGANPYGSLFSDGTVLYGMASSGGTNGKGTIFKYQLLSTRIESRNETAALVMFPNPSDGIVTLKFASQSSSPASLEIYNLAGEKVFQAAIINNAAIDLSLQPDGIYSILIKSGENIFRQQLIKN